MHHDEHLREAEKSAAIYHNDLIVLVNEPDSLLYKTLAESVSTVACIDEEKLTRGVGDANIGERIFRRWSQVLHEFVCKPDKADRQLRDRLLTTLSGDSGGGTLIVAVLAGHFGVATGVATIIAALLLKKIVVPAGEEVCQVWEQKLRSAKPKKRRTSKQGKRQP